MKEKLELVNIANYAVWAAIFLVIVGCHDGAICRLKGLLNLRKQMDFKEGAKSLLEIRGHRFSVVRAFERTEAEFGKF